jgi:IgGFc binding protein/Putative metal-binding motif
MNKTRRPSSLAALCAMFLLGATTAVACGDNGDTSTGQGGAGATTSTSQGGNGGQGASTGGNDPSIDDDGDGFSENDGDCNDNDPNVHPDAEEVCNDGIDNNCNGAQDDSEVDGDGDGFGPCLGDCDDDDPTINPAAPEVDGDNIDNNCDGIVDADFDSDGFTEADGDCDDANPDVNPGETELCNDGLDNDCNGFADANEPDQDMDSFGPCGGDCDDTDAAVNPNAPEIDGDGIDNNCDNLVDLDIDGDGFTVTNGDCADTNPAINPSVLEVCGDNIDNDCDGQTDVDCITACDLAELLKTSVGCTYFAIDANNDPVENYDVQPYAVVVSNIDAAVTANVEVQTRQGGVWTTIQSQAVAPTTLYQFNLPDRHVNYTNVNPAGAYRVISDSPIVAYQFQPVNGQTSFTSDASLLLPTSALDRFYYVAGWGEPSFGNAQINIVAAEDNTSITVTPSVTTVAGGGLPALTANVPYTFPTTYDAGDVIQIEANAAFSGTHVTADKSIAVFSAHWCANIPTQVCCCDHLEEQLIGVQTWGTTYVASRMPVRNSGTPEPTQWHVVASENNTQVSFLANPAVTGLPGTQTLNQGDVLLLQVSGNTTNPGDFVVNADKPILLMEYLSSASATNAPTQQAGDPAMTQAVPSEQFLDNYVVLAPANWINDFLILTKPIGSTVNVDGAAVPQGQFTTIDDGISVPQWEVARIPTTDGVHTLDGSAPFGVIVVGYDSYDSYAYPGGLDQKIINPIN